MVDRRDILEVAGADALFDALAVEELHQTDEAGLGDLLFHCFALGAVSSLLVACAADRIEGTHLDGLDLLVGFRLLLFREGVDVVENVLAIRYAHCRTHLAEHVVLRLAFLSVLSVVLALDEMEDSERT